MSSIDVLFLFFLFLLPNAQTNCEFRNSINTNATALLLLHTSSHSAILLKVAISKQSLLSYITFEYLCSLPIFKHTSSPLLVLEDLNAPRQPFNAEKVIAIGRHIDLVDLFVRQVLGLFIALFSSHHFFFRGLSGGKNDKGLIFGG